MPSIHPSLFENLLQIKLPSDKRLQWPKSRGVSFIHHGDFRVAAVPESLSLPLSYLCMRPLPIELPTVLAPLTKSAGFPGVEGTRERAARASTLQNASLALLSC